MVENGLFWAAMAPFKVASHKTMTDYYDEFGISDHGGVFRKIASYLPAVLLECNSLWLETGGLS